MSRAPVKKGKGFDATVYQEQAALFREGLNALKDEGPDPRISMLEEAVALAEFLAEQIPALHQEWEKRRELKTSKGSVQ